MAKPKRPYLTYIPRTPLPKRYNFVRVKKLYKLIYNITIVKNEGYKQSRHALYERYYAIDEQGNIVLKDVTLNALGDQIKKEYDNPDY